MQTEFSSSFDSGFILNNIPFGVANCPKNSPGLSLQDYDIISEIFQHRLRIASQYNVVPVLCAILMFLIAGVWTSFYVLNEGVVICYLELFS